MTGKNNNAVNEKVFWKTYNGLSLILYSRVVRPI